MRFFVKHTPDGSCRLLPTQVAATVFTMKQTEPRDWPRIWTHAIGREVARVRRENGMTAQALSETCSEFGADIPRNTITNLENGRKETMPLHELVVLAAALLVDPVELLFPGLRQTRHVNEDGEDVDEPTVEYFPDDVIPSREAWARFNGPDAASPRSVRIGQARMGAERVVQLLREVEDSHDG